jgi:DNA-binding transcriptional MerR regulator
MLRLKMKTLTRRETAKKLRIKDTNLIYWERKGKLKPKKIKVGNSSLVVYTPELVEKARKILSRGNRRRREGKLKNECGR